MPTRESSRVKAREEGLQAHQQTDGTYRVYNPKSHSAYTVRPAGMVGGWICECPWQRHGGTGPCKHVTRVMDKEAGIVSSEASPCRECGTSTLRTRLKAGVCGGCRMLDRMGF